MNEKNMLHLAGCFRIPKSNGELNGGLSQSALILKATEGKIPYMLR